MKNRLVDLRNHLFAALEALHDDEKPMAIERALAIAEVGQVLVNSAKVEVDFLKLSGGDATSDFIESTTELPEPNVPRLVGGR